MKKESLSVMTVKTLLAVLLFAGIGTIIIGGGYIVWEYSKNIENSQIMKPVNQETENYYNALEKKCDGDNCCVSSLEYMKENNYKEADDSGRCSEGFDRDMMACITSYHWCVPIKEKKCAKVGEFVNPDNLKGKTDYPDVCCEGLKGVNAYRVNEDGECEVITGTPYLTCIPCENGICDEIGLWFENKCNCPEDCGNENDTSNWQTYQNEEFGFEVKCPGELIIEEFEYVYGKGLSINFTSGSILNYVVGPNFGVAGNKSVVVIDDQNYNMWCQTIEGGESCRILLDKGKEIDFKNLGSSDDFELFKKILSSFKFIEENETSDWQTYRNEEFGFEVKYPSYVSGINGYGKELLDEKSRIQLTFSGFDFGDLDINHTYNCRLFIRDKNSINANSIINRLEKYDWENHFVPKEIDGSNVKMIQKDGYGTIGYYFVNVYFVDDNYLYNFEISGEKYNKDTIDYFEKILSTFKFIEN